MAVKEKNILNRLYFIAGCMFILGVAVMVKLANVQFVHGDKYRAKASKRIVKDFVVPANRGNVYSVNGNLLATTIPKYDVRIDLGTPKSSVFEEHLEALSDSLSVFFGRQPSSYYQKKIRKARANKNRGFLVARNLGYSDYLRVTSFPMLNLKPFIGGLVVEQKVKREHPMGGIAQRTIGYERIDDQGHITRPGIDGAFGVPYLRGKDGKSTKQQIYGGQWKLIEHNQVEPEDGYDVYTTIDVNIQDIAHHALLKQLETYKADHGCAVVMETKTGEVKAIVNLGRNTKGNYYERRNYAVWESHEPGSTFKLMAVAAALEDKVIDTSDIVDTNNGRLTFYGKHVRDSNRKGYGKISVSEAFELSSNTGIVRAIYDAYNDKPETFVDRLYAMNLHDSLGLPIKGEGKAIIPDPRIKNKRWSGIALPWMAFGYGVSFTPLQTLTFYNAIANNGEMVKPQFLKEVKQFDKTIVPFKKEIINKRICSKETVDKVKQLLKNVVEKKHGTGNGLYSKNFSMAGKTGTCQKDYRDKEKLNYISSFAGFFPADNPKYSCIVVIHEPDKKVGYYGADVSGPVFKSIAQKIFIDTPVIEEIGDLDVKHAAVKKEYGSYYELAQKYKTIMPNVVGLPAMDAVALLENMGLKVDIRGAGIVKKQSISKGKKIEKNQKVVLEIS